MAIRQAATAALGDGAADAAWSDGHDAEWRTVAALAQRNRGSRGRPTFGWDSLTPTELAVVELAATGLTNARIGERLLMGSATVKSHLSSAFTKLGIANRTELAAEHVRRRALRPDREGHGPEGLGDRRVDRHDDQLAHPAGVVVAEQVQLLERRVAGIDVDEHERVLRTLGDLDRRRARRPLDRTARP